MSDDEDTGSPSLGFWGTIITPNTPFTYTPPINRMLRLSSAALSHNVKPNTRSSLLVLAPNNTLSSNKAEPIVITTLSNQHPSTTLDLYLLGGEEVTFSVKGDNELHITGYTTYHQPLIEGDEDEEGMYGDEFDLEEYDMDEDEDNEDEDIDEDDVDNEVDSAVLTHGGWQVRPAAKKAVKSIIQELQEHEDEDDDDDMNDSDYLADLIDGELIEEDEEDDDEDEEEEDEDEEIDHDRIREELKDKIRVVEPGDEEGSEDEEKQRQPTRGTRATTAATSKKNVAKQANGKIPTANEQKTPKTTKPAAAAISQTNGTNSKGKQSPKQSPQPATQQQPITPGKRKATESTTLSPSTSSASVANNEPIHTPATKSKKQKTGESNTGTAAATAPSKTPVKAPPAATGTPKTSISANSSSTERTIHCEEPGCGRTFKAEGAMKQHMSQKHKVANKEAQQTTA